MKHDLLISRIPVIAALAFMLAGGCGVWDTAKHRNPFDPLTSVNDPQNVLFNYRYIDDVGENYISFHWVPSPDSGYHFTKIYRTVNDPGFEASDDTCIATFSNQNVTSFQDTGLSPHTLYCYRVAVFGDKGVVSPVLRVLTAPEFVTAIVVWTSGTYTADQYLVDIKYDQSPVTHKLFVTGRGRDAQSDGYFIRMLDAHDAADGLIGSVTSDDTVLKQTNGAPALLASYSVAPLQTNLSGSKNLVIADYESGSVLISDEDIASGLVPPNSFSDLLDSSDGAIPSSYAVQYLRAFGSDLFLAAGDELWLFDSARTWNQLIDPSSDPVYANLISGLDVNWDFSSMYLTGWASQNVVKYPYAGSTSASWSGNTPLWDVGSAGNGNLEFSNPSGLTVDTAEYIYVSDTGNNRIQILDKDGNFLGKWGKYGTGAYEFNEPRGMEYMTYGGYNYIFVAERSTIKIYRY